MNTITDHLKWAKGDSIELESRFVVKGKKEFITEINAMIRIQKNLKAICEHIGIDYDSLK